MALDEPQKNDVTFDDRGITFVIDKELLEETKPIRLDFVTAQGQSGFSFTSSLPVGDGCGCS
jgi:Fe-S cluster assembly iron-binding protein IscA